MAGEQGTQPVGDAVFEILRRVGGEQVAVQVTLAGPLAARVSQRIGGGDKGDAAVRDMQRARIQFGHHAQNGLGAAGFVAVHGAGDDQSGSAALLAGVADGFKMQLAGVDHLAPVCGILRCYFIQY